jgi:hypothetical protein
MVSTARKRYEILVRTRVCPAALARLWIALTPTAGPAKTVHRLRVRSDRDITDVVATLTERGVPVLGVRRSVERLRPRPHTVEQPAAEGEVIVAFPAAAAGTPVRRAVPARRADDTARVLPLVPRPS